MYDKTFKRYRNTAEYIEKYLLGKPEGYPVWLRFEDCKIINRLLGEAAKDSDDPDIQKLYERFNTQYKTRD